jgi:TPR repeat protein
VIAPIFISYSSIDQKVAETICDALQARGYGCWIACRNVMPGENFQEAIVKAIRSAKVMLLVFTSNANNSDEIKKEVVLAGRYRIIVVPIRVEDVAPNDALAYEFATRQWIDLFKDWEREIERLASMIGSILAVGAPARDTATGIPQQLVSKTPAPAGAKPSSLRLMVLLGALAVIALGSGGAYLYRQMAAAPPPVDPLRRVPVTECDRLAANPLDPQRLTGVEGVALEHIDIVPALAACNDAVSKYPDVARFMYQSGRVAHAQQDYAAARRWFEKAAAAGEAGGMTDLGFLYANGHGVPQDYAVARSWYEKAAAAGETGGMTGLGFLYANGSGVPRDYAVARSWYEKAAAAGEAAAMTNLGELYYNGQGVPRDYAAAQFWFEKAAAAGSASAMRNLGDLYLPQDNVTARRWYEKAVAAGDTTAKDRLANLKGP